jgi:hypothetical protein
MKPATFLSAQVDYMAINSEMVITALISTAFSSRKPSDMERRYMSEW